MQKITNTQRDVLNAIQELDEGEGVTTRQVADYLDITPKNAHSRAYRLFINGLVRKERVSKSRYIYSIITEELDKYTPPPISDGAVLLPEDVLTLKHQLTESFAAMQSRTDTELKRALDRISVLELRDRQNISTVQVSYQPASIPVDDLDALLQDLRRQLSDDNVAVKQLAMFVRRYR
jgi:hypothetical protein